VPPGSYKSAAIVLLSDGRRTTGPDPLEAAKLAAERGVRIFTVGFGTAQGAEVEIGGWSIFMRLDEEALKSIAEITRGEYSLAGSEADLRKVYESLSSRLVLERAETEITAIFSAVAALLVLLSAGLSVAWYGRVA
jgi:Ca-activated chloride channel family protein